MFISGIFALELDQVMRNPVLSFHDALREQNNIIEELTNRISNIEQQLETLIPEVDSLEKQSTNFLKSILPSEKIQSYIESDIDFLDIMR